MTDISAAVEHLMEAYDNATGTRQVSLDEAIEITESLIDELQMRLQALISDRLKA
jgi:hypothetical protein